MTRQLGDFTGLVAKLRKASDLFSINVSTVNRHQRYPLACALRDAAEALLAALPEMEKELSILRLEVSKNWWTIKELQTKHETVVCRLRAQNDAQLAQSRSVTEEQIEAAAKRLDKVWVSIRTGAYTETGHLLDVAKLHVAKIILSPTEDRKDVMPDTGRSAVPSEHTNTPPAASAVSGGGGAGA